MNPLYRVEYRDGASILTLAFPTPEYEEEFAEAKRYLPATVTIAADLTQPIAPAAWRRLARRARGGAVADPHRDAPRSFARTSRAPRPPTSPAS